MAKLEDLAKGQSPERGGKRPWDKTEEIGAVKIADGTAVEVTRLTRGNDVYIDIRVYYLDRVTGKFLPTKKGVCLRKEKWPEIKAMVDEASGLES